MAGEGFTAQSRKRPLETDVQNTPIYEMRTLVKDLRPHFIEVLKTPDFRNCKSADEIRQGMKLLAELCKKTTSELTKLEKCSNKPGPTFPPHNAEPTKDGGAQQTYTVGGSAFGWNFVVYEGGQPLYYGRTKEAFRASNPIPAE